MRAWTDPDVQLIEIIRLLGMRGADLSLLLTYADRINDPETRMDHTLYLNEVSQFPEAT